MKILDTADLINCFIKDKKMKKNNKILLLGGVGVIAHITLTGIYAMVAVGSLIIILMIIASGPNN